MAHLHIAYLMTRIVLGALALFPLAALAEAGEDAAEPARRVAEMTQTFAHNLAEQLRQIGTALNELEGEQLGTQLWLATIELSDLLIIIGVTVALLFALRPVARPFFIKAEKWAQQGDERLHTLRRAIGVSSAALADLATVLIAWLGGYALALFLLGETGSIEMRQSLFLNAFLITEGVKAILRILFAVRNSGLRLLPIETDYASYWNSRLARMAGLIGYGLLFLVPLFSRTISDLVGQLATLIIMATAFFYAMTVALRNRNDMRKRLEASAAKAKVMFTRVTLSTLAWTWHWLVIAYFGALAVVTVTQPESALPYMAQATAQSLIVVVLGALIAVALTQATSRRIHLSAEKRQHFPLLEGRLNSYIPIALKAVRALIIVTVLALLLDAWGLLDFFAWIRSEAGLNIIGIVVSVGLVLIAAIAAWIVAASWIEHRLNPEVGKGKPTAREQTLLTLFRNALAVVLVTLTTMIVLAEIGINIGPLIAGAGVLGLAIGFGAQKMVQDIITGVFIQLEHSIDVGDIITAAGVTGTVEKLTVRSVNIRDLAGTFHFIPFSSVDSIANFTRHFAYHVGNYGVAYREDLDEVKPHFEAAYRELKNHPDQEIADAVYDEFWLDGVSSLGDSSVNIRIRIKTAPGMQWAVGRAYNELVKKEFDKAGIEIPFPHRTLYFGQDKDGRAPAARIENVG
ncbi:mechanosensitive ion channel [Halorhodospira halochloris]|uniref:mechanosensitive ion channel domain-containing protein n=1 Tax=Halorhodospira halochloris TaxID=1052 RepID=UPI001EE94FD3|nr:mechanosensitive ion channel [Halorhodospira halochloris]